MGKWEQTDELWLNKVKIVDNINYCLVSNEPYYSYIKDENKFDK